MTALSIAIPSIARRPVVLAVFVVVVIEAAATAAPIVTVAHEQRALQLQFQEVETLEVWPPRRLREACQRPGVEVRQHAHQNVVQKEVVERARVLVPPRMGY